MPYAKQESQLNFTISVTKLLGILGFVVKYNLGRWQM